MLPGALDGPSGEAHVCTDLTKLVTDQSEQVFFYFFINLINAVCDFDERHP